MNELCRWSCITGLLLGFAAHLLSPVSADEPGTFTIWQLPSRTPSQHMSYVVRSVGGKLLVVDGGNTGDAEYLTGFLHALGGKVSEWWISHPHPDHVDALTRILQSSNPPEIDRIYAWVPEDDWIRQHEPQPSSHLHSVQQFRAAVQTAGKKILTPESGQTLVLDGIQLQVLGVGNPEITSNAINNSSIVLRLSDHEKSVLFTGDLGVPGGRKLLQSQYASWLRSDYVQMAHHGQNGVDRDFYLAVRPRFCLWPTPRWLWDNNSGDGVNSGPWLTLTVRDWMDQLNVEHHFVSADGLIRID